MGPSWAMQRLCAPGLPGSLSTPSYHCNHADVLVPGGTQADTELRPLCAGQVPCVRGQAAEKGKWSPRLKESHFQQKAV